MLKNLRSNKQVKDFFLILGLLGFLFLLYARSVLISSDTAWHIKLGEWIVHNRSIPNIDTMSLLGSTKTMKFIAHEWLFDIIVFIINKYFNLHGLVLLTLCFVFVSYAISIKKSGNTVSGVLLSAIFLLLGFAKTLSIRPDTFSAILLVLIGYNFIYEKCSKKALVKNILLSLLMINLHGGMASANLGQQIWLFICLCIINKRIMKEKFIVLLSTFICGFCTPCGTGAYKYIGVIYPLQSYYSDWSSFTFSGVVQTIIVLGVISYAVYSYINSDDKQNIDLAIIFMYLVMLFCFARTLNIFNYAFILYMSKYIKFNSKKLKSISIICYSILSLFLMILVILNNKTPIKTVDTYISNNEVGKEIQDEIRGKRYLNDISLGGYLIYLDEKPFIDTRSDPYLKEYGNTDVFNPYMKAMHSEKLMNKLTEDYNLDYLLLLRNNISSQIFYASDDWEVIKEDKNCVLFKKIK